MHKLQLHTGPYQTTLTGLEIARQSTLKEWRGFGEVLRCVDEAKQWAIGDWLVDGKSHYGDGVYEQAAGLLDTENLDYLRKQKSIAERFELCNRLHNLTWRHHQEVASIKQLEEKDGKLRLSAEPDMEKMQELLAEAAKQNWSVRDLKDAVSAYKRRQDEEIRLFNEPEKFSIILADPAWEYDFSKSDSRQISNQYLTTSLEEMKRLKVPHAEDSVLFMWATQPKIREALELIRAWGFEYKTGMVWVKDKIGMGYYARQKHELLLIATTNKGLELPDTSKRPESVFHADRKEHSTKPDIVYEIIEAMYPEYNKLEMFARQERKGWELWGDEA